jgi:hypothetical protein
MMASGREGVVVMRKELHARKSQIQQSQGCLKASFPVENGKARVWCELRSKWHDRNDIDAGVDLNGRVQTASVALVVELRVGLGARRVLALAEIDARKEGATA